MMYPIITVNELHQQELIREAEHRRLVETATAANREMQQPIVLSRDSVLNDMGHGLMAIGLLSPERRVPRKVYP